MGIARVDALNATAAECVHQLCGPNILFPNLRRAASLEACPVLHKLQLATGRFIDHFGAVQVLQAVSRLHSLSEFNFDGELWFHPVARLRPSQHDTLQVLG